MRPPDGGGNKSFRPRSASCAGILSRVAIVFSRERPFTYNLICKDSASRAVWQANRQKNHAGSVIFCRRAWQTRGAAYLARASARERSASRAVWQANRQKNHAGSVIFCRRAWQTRGAAYLARASARERSVRLQKCQILCKTLKWNCYFCI